MKKYRKLIIIIALILLFVFITIFLVYRAFVSPVSKSNEPKEVEITTGMSSNEIGELLVKNKLIKNAKFFVFYLKLNNINDLKAGVYNLSGNMNLKTIVKLIREGSKISNKEITITFKEGINMREIASIIEENTDNSSDDVMNALENVDYLKSLIEDYWFLTDDILDDDIYYPLEGYLFPDTYKFRSKEVTVEEIFKTLLDQMGIVLLPYKEIIENNNLNVHDILTLASIAEKEVNNADDRAKVISVFNNRIKKQMPLGSDITTRYGLKLDEKRPLTTTEYNSVNAYNTRNNNFLGLPASPIAMVSKSSIEASIRPQETNYLYFISNITTDETFFFETSREFENKKAELNKINGGY